MAEEHLNAKAEAKAAKAKAKALRPWWKKKRILLLAVVVVVVVAVAAGGGGGGSESETTSSGASASGSSDTIGKGLGSKDASGDVDSVKCVPGDYFVDVTVKVTNRSSKASDYFVTVVAESQDGMTKYDDTIVMILNLKPNQTMTEESIFTNDIPAGAVCKVSEVQRTAS